MTRAGDDNTRGGDTHKVPLRVLTGSSLVCFVKGNKAPLRVLTGSSLGFREAAQSGNLIGHPVEGTRVVITDGNAHAVDSSEMAFKLAAIYAFSSCYKNTDPVILEPVMDVAAVCPVEFQGAIIGNMNR
eukprot:3574621-Pyramimonas_sp.AAC.1